ncbi:hypothetical protein TNCT_68371 [Trichonephila clavata]|uniref:Uncharacterized protein n=1 Tax=Trichonephila clavata TaxID=2740835 RepID=A0A8X6G898_TRICU|nr:hypothetical protein TNCT_68371 [Trichonephila clavata]
MELVTRAPPHILYTSKVKQKGLRMRDFRVLRATFSKRDQFVFKDEKAKPRRTVNVYLEEKDMAWLPGALMGCYRKKDCMLSPPPPLGEKTGSVGRIGI